MPRAAHRQHVLAAVVGVGRENAPKGAIKISPRLSLALVIHRPKTIIISMIYCFYWNIFYFSTEHNQLIS
jgi:hypothetical protein